jgi:hypothetical protein
VDLPRRAGLGATILPAIITPGAAESLSKGYYGAPKRDPITCAPQIAGPSWNQRLGIAVP